MAPFRIIPLSRSMRRPVSDVGSLPLLPAADPAHHRPPRSAGVPVPPCDHMPPGDEVVVGVAGSREAPVAGAYHHREVDQHDQVVEKTHLLLLLSAVATRPSLFRSAIRLKNSCATFAANRAVICPGPSYCG